MRIVFYFILAMMLSLSSTTVSWGQEKGFGDCRLDEAKKWYETGQLEKIEEIESCVSDPKSMSREKRIEAIQLITESYLYRNKIGKAEKSYRNLLTLDPLHVVDSTDENNSWDFVYLSRTFSQRPIFSIYVAAGANFSLIEMLENYGVDNTSDTKPSEGYLDSKNIRLGANLGLGIEIPLIYGFDLAFEANFAYRNHFFFDSLYMSVNATNPTAGSAALNTDPNVQIANIGEPLLYSTLSYTENQFWIDLPLILRYNLVFDKLHPYVYVGGGPNFLLYADMSRLTRENAKDIPGGGQILSPPDDPVELTAHQKSIRNSDVTVPTMRTMINWSLVAGAGIKIRVDRHFLFFDFRYNKMFLNNVERQNRYANPDLVYRYAHVDNDYRTDNFALTIGFMGSFYKPRKKQKFNPLVVDNKFNRWLEKERNNIKKETDEELKSELNSTIKELEREKPSLLEDVQRGRVGSEIIKDKKAELKRLKNK